MEHREGRCCFDSSQYTGTPDTAPCPKTLDMPAFIARLDALYAGGREEEAGALLGETVRAAETAGDWRSELSLLGEICGHCRRSGEKERALDAIARLQTIIREHGMGRTVSGATTLLNAATTLKCFGMAAESIPLFQHVCRVYADSLDPGDYRFAGLYNNMALSCADVGDSVQAEGLYRAAMKVIEGCPRPQNELAVTLCNLAELYYRQDAEDERVHNG